MSGCSFRLCILMMGSAMEVAQLCYGLGPSLGIHIKLVKCELFCHYGNSVSICSHLDILGQGWVGGGWGGV